jgi:hypothetical protein
MASTGTLSIVERKLLLVEGKDEVNFFTAALQNHLMLSGIQVIDYSGKANLSAFLRTLLADPAFPNVTGIGIVRDADDTPPGARTAAAAAAYDAIRGALTAQGVQLPCPPGHAQFAAGPPHIGAFVMPNGTGDGMLETLCISSVSAEAAYACVTEFFNCLQQYGVTPKNMHKARARAWLSSRPDPDKGVGLAALSGYWPFTDHTFDDLWNFLKAI